MIGKNKLKYNEVKINEFLILFKSKISHENLKKGIKEMLEKRKQRKFVESVELQVRIINYLNYFRLD